MEKSFILTLYNSPKSVFSVKDIALIWGEANPELVKKRIYRYVKAGKLYHIRKGIYAKNNDYNKFELATKIYTPSYISLETVLVKAGIVFQFYKQIFTISYLTREITVDGEVYCYRKIKDPILANQKGVDIKDNYSIASQERAFLDVVYLNKDYHFDNLSVLNWERVFELLPVYEGHKRMEKKIQQYHHSLREELKKSQ